MDIFAISPGLLVDLLLDSDALGKRGNADLAGYRWQHSREMLRPNFVRTQIGDVDMFEKHVEHLINALPRDGSTVHLQELFLQFSLDVATDLLFGESTNTLAPGFADAEVTEFVDAYGYCLQALDGSNPAEEDGGHKGLALGFLRLFLPNPKLKQQINVVHSTLISFRPAVFFCFHLMTNRDRFADMPKTSSINLLKTP